MRYCIKFGNQIIPIKENEIEKVVRAMSNKSIVILTCGIFSGAFIQGIIRDIWAENKFYYYHKLSGNDRLSSEDFVTDFPEKINKLLNDNKLLLK